METPHSYSEWQEPIEEALRSLSALAPFQEPRFRRARQQTLARLKALVVYLDKGQKRGRAEDADSEPGPQARKRLATTLAIAHSLADPELRQLSEQLASSDYYCDHLRAVRRLGLQPRDMIPILVDPELQPVLNIPRGWYTGPTICLAVELQDGYDPTLLHELVHSGQPHLQRMAADIQLKLERAQGDEQVQLERELEALTDLIEGSTQLLAQLPLDPRQTLPPASYAAEVEMVRALAASCGWKPQELARHVSQSEEALDLLANRLGQTRAATSTVVISTTAQLALALDGLRWDVRQERGLVVKAARRRAYAHYRRALENGPELVPAKGDSRPRLASLEAIPGADTSRAVRAEPTSEPAVGQ